MQRILNIILGASSTDQAFRSRLITPVMATITLSIEYYYDAWKEKPAILAGLGILVHFIGMASKRPKLGEFLGTLILNMSFADIIISEGNKSMWLTIPTYMLAFPCFVMQQTENMFYGLMTYIVGLILTYSMGKKNLEDVFMVNRSEHYAKMLDTWILYSCGTSLYFLISFGLLQRAKNNALAKLHEQNSILDSLNKTLKEKNEELEASLTRNGRFLLSLSHEFRNPLNVIVGNIDIALFSKTISMEIRQLLEDIKSRAFTLTTLMNNLLDSAKLLRDTFEVNIHPANMMDVINDQFRVFKVLIKDKGLCGGFFVSKKMPLKVKLDQARVLQIFSNITSNAIKFTDNGYVLVVMSWISSTNPEISRPSHESHFRRIMESRRIKEDLQYQNYMHFSQVETIKTLEIVNLLENFIEFRLDSDQDFNKTLKLNCNSNQSLYSKSGNGYLKMEIYDSGTGISDEILTKISNMSEQLEVNQIQKDRLGIGISLWITSRLCTELQGALKIHSKLGNGTIAVVCLRCNSL